MSALPPHQLNQLNPNHPIVLERRRRCWTQTDLARKAGVSQRTICAIECGAWTKPTTRRRVCTALGMEYGSMTKDEQAAMFLVSSVGGGPKA